MSTLETKALVEGALFTAIIVILTLLAFYLPPIIGMVLLFILPVPFIVLGVRQGTKTSTLAAVLSAIILGILINPIMILVVLFGFGLIGVVLGAAFEEKFSPHKLIIIAVIAAIVSTLLMVGINFYLFNFNPTTIFNQAIEKYQNLGFDQATLKELEDITRNFKETMQTLFPSLFIIAGAINGLISYYIGLSVLNRLGYEYEYPLSFSEWRFSKYLVFGYLFGIISINTTIGKNLYLIFSFIFLIQGLAVVAHYLKSFNISDKIQKAILVFLAFLPINQIIVFLGLLDVWFDYRKLEEED
ncbi:YybS family protein [Sporohalobacter salinus]|uniref:YybS family protein n=1 Tax=Sporohalobacter salinus TaxID=1494606 RepID=UPI0019606AC4|nr:YybS family protein [Sporohalobacter salinus]MBM7624328.1 uncharacterized protein YybS (DUF2232 family) [Sporohalobacter salinus]